MGSIAFPDNTEQLTLLEGRVGVLALLDEECSLPKGSESSYVEKMHARFSEIDSYAKPSRSGRGTVVGSVGASTAQFAIRHYAGEVCYSAAGWIDKNRSAMQPEVRTAPHHTPHTWAAAS